jgi:hypothetical protein
MLNVNNQDPEAKTLLAHIEIRLVEINFSLAHINLPRLSDKFCIKAGVSVRPWFDGRRELISTHTDILGAKKYLSLMACLRMSMDAIPRGLGCVVRT